MRWPERPPHLALNPPYFFLFCFFFFFAVPFLSFASNGKKPVFPHREGHFLFIFESLPLFLLSLLWPPPFQFLLLCVSLVLFFLYFFLLVLLFCCILVPYFCLSFFVFLSSLLLFHEGTTSKYSIAIVFHQSFLFWVSCLVFAFKSYFLSLIFPNFKFCFLFNINVLGFKKPKLKNTNFWSKGSLLAV